MFTYIGGTWSAASKTSSSSLTTTANGANVAVGSIHVVIVAKNNTATVDGDNSEVISVTDSQSNVYAKAAEFTNSQDAADAGATVAIWWSKITTALVPTDTITANFSAAIVAKALVGFHVSVAAGNTIEVEASTTLANDAADPGAMNLTVANIEHLWVRGLAHERPGTDVFTKTAIYLTATFKNGTTGGSAVSNMLCQGELDIFTGTSNISDPSWSDVADEASVLVAFKEVTPPATTFIGWYGNMGGWF